MAIVALIIGKLQGSRLEDLEQRLASSERTYRSKTHVRESINADAAYRSKYQRTSKRPTVEEVYQSVLGFRAAQKGGTLLSDLATMAHRNTDALKILLHLDPSGLKELITIIGQSKDPILGSPAIKYEQITLCIIAMADHDPVDALAFIISAKEEMPPVVFKERGPADWLEYVLTRLSDHDPQSALNALVNLERDLPETFQDERVSRILEKVARRDPDLVLDAVDRMPEPKIELFVNSLFSQFQSADEQTALFQAFREHYRKRPDLMKAGLISLCKKFGDARALPADTRNWADSLEMLDSEKLVMFNGLREINIAPSEAEDYARWFAGFMPESDERDLLLWKVAREWESVDPSATLAFLTEHGIDPMKMMKLERGED